MREPRPNALHVRVTAEVLDKLNAIADRERRPVATLIAILVDEALEAREAAEPVKPVRKAPAAKS